MKDEKQFEILNNIITLIKPIILLLGVGLLYLLIVRITGYGIPCVFHRLTGYLCPGCGMTHAITEISKGNFRGAFEHNALSITILPITCIYLLYRYIREKKYNDEVFYIWEYVLLVALLVIVLSYGFYRNN